MKKLPLTTYTVTQMCLAGMALVATSAQAALINWESDITATVDTDISTNGTSLIAINAGGADVTVNGVLFTGVDLAGANALSNLDHQMANTYNAFNPQQALVGGDYDSLSAEYQTLMASGFWGINSSTDTVTFSELTIGYEYEVQLFGNDARNGRHEGFITLIDGTAELRLNNLVSGSGDTNGVGGSIIGTFTADAETQSFDMTGLLDGGSSESRTHIQALQLRQITVIPEPSSAAAIFGLLGAISMLSRRRR